MKHTIFLTAVLTGSFFIANAQQAKPEDTEIWEPAPKVVTAGNSFKDAPSDAIILFNGKNLDEWVQNNDQSPAKWDIKGDVLTVNKKYGNIETKRSFTNYQLHLEWKVPANIEGSGQARGNSGVFLASIGKGDAGYELQVLDSYNNKTYVKWTAPTFNDDGSVKTKARVTVFFNGVLVENNFELWGPTLYIGKPIYKQHGPSPIKLQAHGDKSEPLSFRNIWVREL
jgi:hypothetical protein